MAPGMTPAKRFIIRTALISGSTVALVVGAQTLIAVDVQAGRMTKDGSTISSSTAAQSSSDSNANSGISVLRPADAPALQFSGDDDDSGEGDEGFFRQQQQPDFNQQSQLFNTQQTNRPPRTHSSR